MAVVPGVDQDRATREVVGDERSRVDGARARAGHIDPHRRYVDEPLERQLGEVLPVGETVERAVDVRPGVAAQRDDVIAKVTPGA